MNKLKFTIALTVILSLTMAICTFANQRKEQTIEEIIDSRISILNTFYQNKADYDETKEKLKLIESGEILKEDVSNLSKYDSTDIEEIHKYEINYVNYKRDTWKNYFGDYTVTWHINDGFSTDISIVKYSFDATTINNKIKLTNVNILK